MYCLNIIEDKEIKKKNKIRELKKENKIKLNHTFFVKFSNSFF